MAYASKGGRKWLRLSSYKPCSEVFFLPNQEAKKPPNVPAVEPIRKFVDADIPAAPADCKAAIHPPALAAATPPPLAMAAIDINRAARDPATMPPEEKPAADKASGAAATAKPPTNTPPPITLE